MGKVAVVTGATRGIGLGVAQKLLAEGWTVVGTGTGPEENYAATLADLRTLGTFDYQPCRLGEGADRENLAAYCAACYGGVDALVNNAGVAPRVRADLLDLTEENYDFVLDTNLKGTFFLTQAFARQMAARAGADPAYRPVIVIVSSLSAYASSTNRAEYCISKAGLAQVTALFADRLSEYGINVYEIRPGIIATDMTGKVKEKYDRLIEGGLLPLARWGQPDDVAQAVWAVCAGLLPYSTGEVLNVDGGFHLRRL